jgi:hypothetical protein
MFCKDQAGGKYEAPLIMPLIMNVKQPLSGNRHVSLGSGTAVPAGKKRSFIAAAAVALRVAKRLTLSRRRQKHLQQIV